MQSADLPFSENGDLRFQFGNKTVDSKLGGKSYKMK